MRVLRNDWCYSVFLISGFIISVIIGIAGIDFGPHWDEPNTIKEVARAVHTGVLLPRWYNYPGFLFDVSLGSLITQGISLIAKNGFQAQVLSRGLSQYIASSDYTINLRTICFLITQFGALGVSGAMIFLGYRSREAAICGLLLLSSWQIQYHARWIAPDALLMSATAIFIPLSIAACQQHRALAWGKWAALAAGVAISCKYPGGLLLIVFLPCFYMWLVHLDKLPKWSACREIAVCMSITTIVFFALTPGAYVEPLRFIDDVNTERLHYTVAGHGTHTIQAIWPRFVAINRFLFMSCFSPYVAVSWVLLVFALIGAVRAFKHGPITFCLLIGPTALGILYFSTVKVVFVRNYLFIFPYILVLATVGIANVIERRSPRILRTAAIVLIVASIGIDFAFGAKAAYAISQRATIDFGAVLKQYVMDHQREHIYVTPNALTLAGLSSIDGLQTEKSIENSDYTIYDTEEFDWYNQYHNETSQNLCNKVGTYRLIAGTYEVDWDYYPDSAGDPRLMMIDTRKYQQLKGY